MIRITELPKEWVEPTDFEFERDILLKITFRRLGASEKTGVLVAITEEAVKSKQWEVIERRILQAIRLMLTNELRKVGEQEQGDWHT